MMLSHGHRPEAMNRHLCMLDSLLEMRLVIQEARLLSHILKPFMDTQQIN